MYMELKERLNILVQAAELAQKAGILTLDEASIAKQAIDLINANQGLKAAANALVQVAIQGQRKGAYTLKDAYIIYLATDGINDAFPVEQPPVPVEKPIIKKENKK